jgi:hypothetical protein
MDINAFFDVLREARNSGALIGVFSDASDPGAFAAGFVEAVSKEHVVLRQLSPQGRYDGFHLIALQDIFRVDGAGRYLERLKFLSTAREERTARLFKSRLDEDANLVVEMLMAVQNSDLLVTVSVLDGDDVSGAVKNIGNETATLTRLDHFGVSDYEAVVHLEAISSLLCDDEELQTLRLLRQHQQNQLDEPPKWLKF